MVYPKRTDLSVSVAYYKDTTAAANLIGTETMAQMRFGDLVTASLVEEKVGIDAHKPAGYASGVLQDTSVSVAADGSSLVRVLYTKKANLTAQVVYHTDSAAGPVIGYSPVITSLIFGSTLAPASYLGTPPVGHKAGVAAGTPWTVADVAPNQFHVYYPVKNDLTYKIRYHKDSATGEVITTSAASGILHRFGEGITLSATELNAQKAGLGLAYGSGVQAVSPHIMTEGENIIDVYYPKLNDQSVTISYVTETLLGNSTTQEVVSGKNVGDTIELTPSQIAAHSPAGTNHEAGVQQGGAYTVVPGTNGFTVFYALKAASYTVKYYKDSVATANYIGESAASGSFKATQVINLTGGERNPSSPLFDTLLAGYVRIGSIQ